MRVLIVGSSGQLGHCLVRSLQTEHDILALDRQQLDICEEQAVEKVFATFQPQFVINAAAYTAVDKAESEPEMAYRVNEEGPKLLAQECHHHGCPLVHISTDYVFDGDKNGLYCEDDRPAPGNIYGMSKLAGEHAVQHACSQYYILRTSWVFSEFGNNFVKTMLRQGAERTQLGIVSDQVGGPTYAGDIARVIGRLLERFQFGEPVEYGLYHFSGMPHVSWFEFAQAIFGLAHEQGVLKRKVELKPLSTREYPTAAIRPMNSRLDSTKLKSQLQLEASDWKAALNQLDRYVEQK
ncbi:dTDP-4-dehydrorhamnose reductase [Vibrio vulnificus YJ016]|uniref:dTDP-4-dehydrorhamnose reductase n=1 Tax=Vibrio vulnificus (strain YJ016) TaxID=196600 RepID=Q7MPR0_VIBVY|nr:dTDP-4-dehydrorhamnose reductase [Vibrio vulnificus]PWY33653.1 dTDP-4-dehydrorhamnose reductase [Vibrio vulnificus]BAC93066.1 dTDP-4-dehydrorhamnose reductase [Vibrio vulnificus YJ016]HAS6025505.1 dTDP-4-dehydrorhamnose reductase [Vibrio vulnificus]HAS6035289.1 dTDP-4-dehydrorhamnose reductase [Vibrio vulnificus]HDY8018463.1 dTDP-4-dehydrorhamnose reductase [Vibrio vulnificus]